MAAISYDSVEVLKSFADRKKIEFPMPADPDSKCGTDRGPEFYVGDSRPGKRLEASAVGAEWLADRRAQVNC